MNHEEIPTKEIGELLDTISEKLPRMIKELMGSLYSQEAAQNMGKAVGIFYKELLNSGISADDALQMTKDYMNTLRSLTPTNIHQ